MIEFKGVSKKFGKLVVLNNLDLKINEGGVFAILGPNSSGKTTMIKCLLGMVLPNKGDILFNDVSILKKWTYRKKLNYLPQIANFPPNLSVAELIDMVKDIRSKDADETAIVELFGLEVFMNKKLGSLSGGTKQKVNLVLAFMFESDLIVLDEPTTGLDPISLIHLKALINKEKEAGKTILISTHSMSFVDEMANEIVFLLDGKIFFKGGVDSLKKQMMNDNFEEAIANLQSERYA